MHLCLSLRLCFSAMHGSGVLAASWQCMAWLFHLTVYIETSSMPVGEGSCTDHGYLKKAYLNYAPRRACMNAHVKQSSNLPNMLQLPTARLTSQPDHSLEFSCASNCSSHGTRTAMWSFRLGILTLWCSAVQYTAVPSSLVIQPLM